jgi:hypothetical protein
MRDPKTWGLTVPAPHAGALVAISTPIWRVRVGWTWLPWQDSTMNEPDVPITDPAAAVAAAIRFHDDMVDRYEANRRAAAAGDPLPTELREVLRLEDEIGRHVKALQASVNRAFDEERAFRSNTAPHPFLVSNTLGSTWRMLVSSALGERGSAPPMCFAADRGPAPSV